MVSAIVLAVALEWGSVCAPAQDALDARYQQGVELFNNAKMEDACDLLQQVDKEKPGYKQTKTYMNAACSQVKRMIKMEEDLFNEGVQHFNQGRLDDAKQKLEQANKIPLKNPTYRTQANRYLKDIETRQSEEHLFQEGVQLFNGGKHADAFTTFEKVVRGGGPKAAEAQGYLDKLKQLAKAPTQPAKPPAAVAGTTGAAQPPPHAASKELPKPTGEPASSPGADEEALRTGLQGYFEGKMDDAERDLSNYLSNKGSKQALAFFFRGAARSTRYYLSGQKDSQQKDLALADFRALKEHSAQFNPPKKFVSPQILAIYNEALPAQ